MRRLQLVIAIFGLLVLLAPAAAAVTTVEEVAKLFSPDGRPEDGFGYSVALDGDTAIVGAPWSDWWGPSVGSAYLFMRDAFGEWTVETKLWPARMWGDQFGYAVTLDGDTAIIGAFGDDENGPNSGAAYVFVRDAFGEWRKHSKLFASDVGFGFSVALDGDTAIIGAGRWVYAFRRDAFGEWTEEARLLGGATPVALDGDTAITLKGVSAYVFVRDRFGEWTEQAHWRVGYAKSIALDGDTAITRGKRADSTQVFMRDAFGAWTEQAPLFSVYGNAVALDRDTAIIGLSVFGYALGHWGELGGLTPSDWPPTGLSSLALDGNTAIVGSDTDDDNGYNSGAVYIYDLKPFLMFPPPVITPLETD